MIQTGEILAAILLPSLMLIIMLTAWVITIIALWRGMKAHESIADSLRMLANSHKQA